MNKRLVLVTGANGFIGQRLCVILSQSAYVVRAAIRREDREFSRKYETVVRDINPQTQWGSVLKNVDTVIHLAARVHLIQEHCKNSFLEYHKVNVLGTERLAYMAAQYGVRRFIFLSSIKVNGEFTSTNDKVKSTYFTEEDKPNPLDPYGYSKWEAEQALHKIANNTKLEIVILRLPLVYGPRVKANFLNLIKLTKLGIPLPFASINNKRSFIFIDNLVDIIKQCIENQRAAGQTYLVSDGQDISTPYLVNLIAKAMGRKAVLLPFPVWLLKLLARIIGKPEYMDRLTNSLCVRNDKIVKDLAWKRQFDMEEGIKKTVNYYLSGQIK